MRKLILLFACFLLPLCAGLPTGSAENPSQLTPVPFASLGSPANGAVRYCTNCQATSPCTAGGSGAVASRVQGAWNCATGGSTSPGGSSGDIQYNNAGAFGGKSLSTLKSDLSLNLVDNTSDANKPVSTAQQTALNLKANLAGPVFTGQPTIPDFTNAQHSHTNAAGGGTLNASAIAAGQLADARLSANVPLLDAANTFAAGQTIARGSVSSGSALSITSTWTGGGTFPGSIFLNVTDSSSASGSLLMDLQVGGSSKFKVDKGGVVTIAAGVTSTTATAGSGSFTSSLTAGGGMFHNISGTKTSNYTIASTDYTILADASGGAFQVTLPTAVTRAGQVYIIKNVGASGTVTVGTTSSQTIDGATTYALSTQYSTVTVQANGSVWQILSKF